MPRTVSYTLQPVTAAECVGIGVTRQTDGEGGTVLVCTFSFEIKDENGTVRDSGSCSAQLTPAQRTSLANFVANVGIPLFNTEQGL